MARGDASSTTPGVVQGLSFGVVAFMPPTSGLHLQRLDFCTSSAYTFRVGIFEDLAETQGFQWDEGNSEKNWKKHQVSNAECEQPFFHQPLVVAADLKHSDEEPRFYALGRTDLGRRLFIVFTLREDLVRVISARDMSRRERKEYARHE